MQMSSIKASHMIIWFTHMIKAQFNLIQLNTYVPKSYFYVSFCWDIESSLLLLSLGCLVPWYDLCDVNITVEPVEVWKPEENPFDLGEAVCLVCSLFLAHLLQHFPSGKKRADTRDFRGLLSKLICIYNWLCSSNVIKLNKLISILYAFALILYKTFLLLARRGCPRTRLLTQSSRHSRRPE